MTDLERRSSYCSKLRVQFGTITPVCFYTVAYVYLKGLWVCSGGVFIMGNSLISVNIVQSIYPVMQFFTVWKQNRRYCRCPTGNIQECTLPYLLSENPDYTTMAMSTCSSLTYMDYHPTSWKFKVISVTEMKQIFYRGLFLNHYRYRHYMDNHNNFFHSLILIKDDWGTKHWPDCVHTLLIAVTGGEQN